MRLTKTLLSLLALVSTIVVEARSSTGQRVLVVIEHALNRAEYSKFWDSLQARGFELTFKGPREETHPLTNYGQRQFDHLIMMAPSTTSFAEHLKPAKLLPTILDSGINTLFLSSSDQSDVLSTLYREFDLEFQKKQTGLIAHTSTGTGAGGNLDKRVSFPLAEGLHKEAPKSIIPLAVRDAGKTKPLIFEGITHSPGHMNPFVVPVLHAPYGAFSGDLDDSSAEDDEDEDRSGAGGKNKLKQVISGEEAGLVSVFQSRSNARFGWIGGVGMINDDVWTAENLNPEFISSLTSWVFQETGVVKVLSTEHYRLKDLGNGTTIKQSRDRFAGYTVKEDVTYEITLAQHDPSNNSSKFAPIQIDDLQLDFTMLDPHVRTGIQYAGDVVLEDGSKGSLYRKTFTVPDRHGVFKFVVDWWRPGYSFVHESTTTSVIPFRHDEYPRFIQGAYPFYTGAFLVSGSFLLFCYLWLNMGAVEGDRVLKAVDRDGKKTK